MSLKTDFEASLVLMGFKNLTGIGGMLKTSYFKLKKSYAIVYDSHVLMYNAPEANSLNITNITEAEFEIDKVIEFLENESL